MTNDLAVQNGAATATEKLRIPVASGSRGLELTSFEDMWRFAVAVSKSGLAPKGMEHAEACFVAIQMGAELGVSPMAAIQGIAVINGRPGLFGDLMLAVCQSRPVFDHEAFCEEWRGSGDDMTAVCQVRRLPDGKVCIREFSVAKAKKAGLWGTATWAKYPERMLQMRARAFALRDTFADILRGFKCQEELYGDALTVESSEPPKSLDELTTKLESPAKPLETKPEPMGINDPDPFRDESPKQPAKKAKAAQNRGLLEDDPEPSGAATYPNE